MGRHGKSGDRDDGSDEATHYVPEYDRPSRASTTADPPTAAAPAR